MGSKKQKFLIAPFKQQVRMDPNYAEKTWSTLKEAIYEIHRHNASGLSFEELYRKAYNMVLHKYGERLYSGLQETVDEHLKTVAEAIAASNDDSFLTDIKSKWDEHKLSMVMIRDILMYMDRTYVMTSKKTPVYELGLQLFRDNVARNGRIKNRLQTTLLSMIHKERNCEQVEWLLLRSITQMLWDLGRDVYAEDFEKGFLDESAQFYQIESQEFIASNSCSEYLKKAESRLKEESARVNNYLDSSTEPKIRAVVESELIAKHLKRLVEMENSGLISMLKDDKTEDLARMYDLFRRVKDGLLTMKEVMNTYVRGVGKALINDEEKAKEPVSFVMALLDMKDKFDKLITQSFNNDKTFQNALNQAFEHFINLNSRSPEYLSLFVDEKLRKGLKGVTEEEVEATLDKVMMLFRYIQEKDVFEKYYKQHFAKRLLSQRSVSDEAERSLIAKLKMECGHQFTSKLEGMFHDMSLSTSAMEQFRNYLGNNGNPLGGIDMTVTVLTTGFWPTQAAARCILPKEVANCTEEFDKFYLTAHTGRRLTWQTNMGTADIRAYFGSRKYELNVSTNQMCILLLFNSTDTLSYADIKDATAIHVADLKRNLQSLACAKYRVLNKEPRGKDINETDVFSFNASFSSKLMKVKIGTVAAQKETEVEKQETRQRVDEDRKPQIEAAIVRVMKSRKTMEHNNLISEVTKQLSSRFLPNPTVIKKRIESLIEREFLERCGDDRRMYRYLA
eukprot:CAMPEP_0184657638 /NCGR_PEP_ID=MMETSP0308-20130426/20785_1 /TAXON_ID=38269 /ORGANISM="Gloeochaete witrockiana, Strain SAG 46.84" /LENGTH=732 /DNA_ID=CAMNT_0027095707 /DNA_START=65 /DNA_END=2263 /DNA_ORIENTATION=-